MQCKRKEVIVILPTNKVIEVTANIVESNGTGIGFCRNPEDYNEVMSLTLIDEIWYQTNTFKYSLVESVTSAIKYV